MADPEQIYAEVLSEEQGKGVSAAVAEGRAKAARARAEHGSPHPKEPKWWPGAQPHLEGGDGAEPAEAEPAAAEPAAEAEPAAAEPEPEPAAEAEPAAAEPERAAAEPEPAAAEAAQVPPTEEVAVERTEQAPAAETAPSTPTERQPAAAAAAEAPPEVRPSGVTHGTTTGTRLRPEDEVTTEAQFQGQQAVYERRKLIDELIASGVPAAAAAEAGEKRSPMLFLAYLLIPLAAIFMVLSLDEGGGGGTGGEEAAAAEGDGGQTITAASVQFDKQELTFPAEEESQLRFVNEDSVEHNVAIYETEDAEKDLFVGQIIGAGETTYEIPAMPKGEYFFRCDVHPTSMVGTALVE